MGLTRRKFLETSVYAGAGISASRLMRTDAVIATHSKFHPTSTAVQPQVVPVPTSEWIAATPASAYRAYRSKPAKTADATTWVQIDLGTSQPIDIVKAYPANEKLYPGRDEHYAGEGFPVRFKIETSEDPDFPNGALIVDHTDADYANPKGRIEQYKANGVRGRYVRLTATRLMDVEGERRVGGGFYLALGKMDVYSGGKEIAALCPVAVDSTYGQ